MYKYTPYVPLTKLEYKLSVFDRFIKLTIQKQIDVLKKM